MVKNGFTLIEILIVIVIISIVGSIAVITIGHNQNKKLETITFQIVNLISLAQEQAILQPAVYGLKFSRNSLQFYQYQDIKNIWQPSNDILLGKKIFSTDIDLSIQKKETSGDKKNSEPDVIISPNGDITTFELMISNFNQPPRYKITGSANGTIKAEFLNEH